MAWDAGSIIGKLMLDIDGEGGFATSMMTAEGIARIFPEIVTDFLTDPILGFADALKEAGETAIDTFKEIQHDAEDVGLASIKLGVTPEFFSEWAAIASTVNVGQDQLSQGLRYLEMHAQEALEGSKTAAKGFADVGISMSDLAIHQNDAAWLFDRVREGMDRLPQGQERVNAGQELMSRGGQALLPVLAMTQDHINDLKKTFTGFGDQVDSDETKAAQKFQDLESVGSWAMEGIQKAVEKPVLTFLADHSQQIQEIITEATTWTIGKVNELWDWIDGPRGHAALQWVETEGKAAWGGITGEVKEVTEGIEKAWGKMQQPETRAELQGIKEDFEKMWATGKLWTSELIDHLPEIVTDLRELNDFIVSALPKIGDAAVYVIHALEALHDMSAQDWSHLSPFGPQGGQTMHSGPLHKDPEKRRREEDEIRKQFHGFQVPADWSDDLVDKTAQQAAAKSAGVYKPNPGPHRDDAQMDPADEQQEIMAKIISGTATQDDRSRFLQLAPQPAAQQSAASQATDQKVTINVQTLHVTATGRDGPIDKAVKKLIDDSNAKAAAQLNAQASMGGT